MRGAPAAGAAGALRLARGRHDDRRRRVQRRCARPESAHRARDARGPRGASVRHPACGQSIDGRTTRAVGLTRDGCARDALRASAPDGALELGLGHLRAALDVRLRRLRVELVVGAPAFAAGASAARRAAPTRCPRATSGSRSRSRRLGALLVDGARGDLLGRVFSLLPRSSRPSLMCSYWRSRFSVHRACGHRASPGCLPLGKSGNRGCRRTPRWPRLTGRGGPQESCRYLLRGDLHPASTSPPSVATVAVPCRPPPAPPSRRCLAARPRAGRLADASGHLHRPVPRRRRHRCVRAPAHLRHDAPPRQAGDHRQPRRRRRHRRRRRGGARPRPTATRSSWARCTTPSRRRCTRSSTTRSRATSSRWA